ncbi:hypothetical protein ACQKWADRAFT_330550 [Trichoderma austrokoningii]
MTANPCTKPNLPPIRIELSDIPCDESHQQYFNGLKAVKAYWRQATNMTLEDQVEYKTLIEQQRFERPMPWLFSSPEDHSVYKSCETSPTWAKYVFINALDINTSLLDDHMKEVFGSLKICDFEECYRTYNPEPARELKRKAADQPQRQTRDFSQRDASVTPVQSFLLEADLQRLENHLKDLIDGKLDEIRNSVLDACSGQGRDIDSVLEQLSLVMNKMHQLEREQTECFIDIERKIDKLVPQFTGGEI